MKKVSDKDIKRLLKLNGKNLFMLGKKEVKDFTHFKTLGLLDEFYLSIRITDKGRDFIEVNKSWGQL